MKEINFLETNNFSKAVKFIEKYENDKNALRSFVIENSEEHGTFLLSLLSDIAYRKNTSFWFENIAFLYAFCFFYLEGAQKSSLFYFLKAYELNTDNVAILEAVLDFQLPPEKILSDKETVSFAKKILEIDPNNKKATKVLKSVKDAETNHLGND